MEEIIFNIYPVPKPRMVRSDIWSKRKVVGSYWAYKDELNYLAKQKKYEIGHRLNIIFCLPMPKSWSIKKRELMEGKPHDQRPDLDNLFKGFTDCLMTEDSKLYKVEMSKYWAKSGYIKIFC